MWYVFVNHSIQNKMTNTLWSVYYICIWYTVHDSVHNTGEAFIYRWLSYDVIKVKYGMWSVNSWTFWYVDLFNKHNDKIVQFLAVINNNICKNNNNNSNNNNDNSNNNNDNNNYNCFSMFNGLFVQYIYLFL